ncbi:carotenoid oxygenase family protein [Streptomyces sp. V4I2]|uniref:carotenoid oxygenase family protein n=1 Tax=Streptomyces sp. V4I2 TaxID=3042280 RepID=UPI0027871831|nr:carotenoid oxygenase family protein [Streptomyces sp. V4I2]MDQ1051464.1 carotenoid cleavage dioxygenase-like enzyme [Streptomyces sp. V4I2]
MGRTADEAREIAGADGQLALTHHVASEKGELIHSEDVPDACASLKHDFALTERYVVFVEGTVTFDPTETSGIPYAWKDEQPARIGVLSRRAGGAHRGPGGLPAVLELVGGRTGARSHPQLPFLQPAMGERIVDDLVVEFPTINEELTGRRHRYQYAISFPDDRGAGNFGVVKYDRTTGTRSLLNVGDGRLPSEAVFVPAEHGTSEDDGYLLTVVSDLHADTAQLLVLDATDIRAAPVATVHLPRRVAAGIHGSWIPDQD